MGREESEVLSVRVGLRQRCIMSPRLINLFMDGVVEELNEIFYG